MKSTVTTYCFINQILKTNLQLRNNHLVRNHVLYYFAKTCDNFDKNRGVNIKFEMYGTYRPQFLGNKKAATGLTVTA